MKSLIVLLTFSYSILAQDLLTIGQQGAPATALTGSFAAAPAAIPADGNAGRKLYGWSIAALAAGSAADMISSWKRPEANPFLGTPGANFGLKSAAVKTGLEGTSLVLEVWALHHNPRLYRKMAWLNFSVGVSLGGVAYRNARVR